MTAYQANLPAKVLMYIVVFVTLALIIAAVILFYIPFLAESLINRTIALLIYTAVILIVYHIYGRDYFKHHPKEHRIRIVLASGALAGLTFMIAFSVFLGSPQPYLPYLWILVILSALIGALIAHRITRPHNSGEIRS